MTVSSLLVITKMILVIAIKFRGLTDPERLLSFDSLLFKIRMLVLIVRFNVLDHLILIKLADLILFTVSNNVFDLELIFWQINHIILRCVIITKIPRVDKSITRYLLKLFVSFVDISQVFDHVNITDQNVIVVDVHWM